MSMKEGKYDAKERKCEKYKWILANLNMVGKHLWSRLNVGSCGESNSARGEATCASPLS